MGVFKGENREFSPLMRAQALPGAASITGSNFRRLRWELLTNYYLILSNNPKVDES